MDFDDISDHKKYALNEAMKDRFVHFGVEFRFTMNVTPAARDALRSHLQQFLEDALQNGKLMPPGVGPLVEKVWVTPE